MIRRLLPMLAGIACLAAPLAAETVRTSQIRSRPGPALNEAERAGYAAIFSAIRAGDWLEAQAGLERLPENVLHPVARAELYLAKGSPKVELEPLQALIAKAPEMPQAAQLARLAVTRGAETEPVLPTVYKLTWQGGQPRRGRNQATRKDEVAAALDAQIQPLIVDNQPAAAEALLIAGEAQINSDVLAEFRQRIGWSYYIIGDDQSARRLADLARAGTGNWALAGEWLAGLTAWRLHDCRAAGTSFATVAARTRDIELAAAGHYWASRADMMCGYPHYVENRLRAAAKYTETFYGLLAQSALGIRPAPLESYRDAEWVRIADRPNVKAALALVEIREHALAEEFIRHEAKIRPAEHGDLIHLASDLALPTTQIWLANNAPAGARVGMTARYPMPAWAPPRGWRVDQSLALAHTLQESAFRYAAVSTAGAVGLMQVRPGSASDIAKARREPFDPRQLTDPNANFEFGQTHLEKLRDMKATGGLLPKVVAAYNAGAGPVSEWNSRAFDRGDPLLYIESLPYWETREYVPVVLRNYWIYEQAAGRQASTSREALVQGLWPRFPGMPGATAVKIRPGNYAATPAYERTGERQ